jgi:predicted glycosyltransferase
MNQQLKQKKIWIDLDNTPHVPFFDPIIKELRMMGYEVIVTARDCAQTCGLADLHGLQYRRVGRHYGKNKVLKVLGTVYRAMQLSKTIRRNKSILAVSHGSRSQMISAAMLRMPSLVMGDYEHTKGDIHCTWVMVPEVIDHTRLGIRQDHVIRYPGIKEDVYIPFFKPDPHIFDELNINPSEVLVTIRPPANEAHYHNPESESLFTEAVSYIGEIKDSRMVILPRNDNQKTMIRSEWTKWCSERKIVIPDQVVDGLNLLWHSDFAISGGGTMNREAAALGIPVYSIFRGRIGAVDQFLSDTGRLILLEKKEDVRTKLVINKRAFLSVPKISRKTLQCVVQGILKAANSN